MLFMKKVSPIAIQLVQHLMAAFLLYVIYTEQYILTIRYTGNNNIMHSPYLSGLLIYYAVSLMYRSCIIAVKNEKQHKLIVHIAPLLVLVLACLSFAPDFSVGQIVLASKGIIFPEFVFAFIYAFEPNKLKH